MDLNQQDLQDFNDVCEEVQTLDNEAVEQSKGIADVDGNGKCKHNFFECCLNCFSTFILCPLNFIFFKCEVKKIIISCLQLAHLVSTETDIKAILKPLMDRRRLME